MSFIANVGFQHKLCVNPDVSVAYRLTTAAASNWNALYSTSAKISQTEVSLQAPQCMEKWRVGWTRQAAFLWVQGSGAIELDLRNHISNIIGRRKCHFRWDQWWMDGIWGFSVGLHCSLSRWPKLPVILWIIPRRTITLQPRAGIAFADVMFSSPPMPAALWKHAVRPCSFIKTRCQTLRQKNTDSHQVSNLDYEILPLTETPPKKMDGGKTDQSCVPPF